MIKTQLTVEILTHFLLTVFYSINISPVSLSLAASNNLKTAGLLLIPNGSDDKLNSTIELSTDLVSRLSKDDPSLINATSDIPIWDSSNIDSDTTNETIKSLIDNMDNITTPIFMVPDDLEVTVNGTLDTDVTVNVNLTDQTTTSPTTTTTTSEPTISSESSSTTTIPPPSTTTMSTSSESLNESKVIYETTTTEKINLINIDKHLNEGDKPGGGGGGGEGSTDEDAELLPGENQASRVACNLDGDLFCSGSIPTCYGLGNIECGQSGQSEATGAQKRSTTSQRFADEPLTDQCQISGDIICSPMVSRGQCKGSATCKANKMEETMMTYNYWQILLIAGALAIICVTIIVVGIVGYFSWTRYKVRPEANGQTNQASDKP